MKSKTVKITSLLLVLMLAVGILSSCGGGGNSTNTNSTPRAEFPAYTPGNGGGNNYPNYTPQETPNVSTPTPETPATGAPEESVSTPGTSPSTPAVPPSGEATSLTKLTSTGEIAYKYYSYPTLSELSTTDTNLFPYKYSSKYGYADEKGNIVISEQYDTAYLFSEGKAFVKKDESWHVIDTSGNVLYDVPSGCQPESYGGFKNGKAVLTHKNYTNQETTVLFLNDDFTGTYITFPAYDIKVKLISKDDFTGLLIYQKGTNSSGVLVYNYILYDVNAKNNIWNTQIPYENSSALFLSFEYDKILSAKTGPEELLNLLTYENGYINVFNDKLKWGLLNVSTGEMAIDYGYEYVGAYSDGLCNVCSYGKWGYVDLNGNKATEFNFLYAEKFVNGLALVVTSDYYFNLIDTSGSIKQNSGCKLEKVSFSTCQYGIYTDLQKDGIIIIHDYFGDKYYFVFIGGKSLYAEEGNQFIFASDDHILCDGEMYTYS